MANCLPDLLQFCQVPLSALLISFERNIALKLKYICQGYEKTEYISQMGEVLRSFLAVSLLEHVFVFCKQDKNTPPGNKRVFIKKN